MGEARIGMAAPYNLAWLSLRQPESVISRVTLVGDRIKGKELGTFFTEFRPELHKFNDHEKMMVYLN